VQPPNDAEASGEHRGSAVADLDRLRVQLADGVVRGVTRGGIDSWRGIPYARPPIGALRWRAPDSVVPWSGERDASRFGTISAQFQRNPRTGLPSLRGSGEDCLTINVHVPSGEVRSASLPVMVFIHGGGYSAGSSREFSEQGQSFIHAGPIVYVSFNYRLGPLGYLDFTRYSAPDRGFESNLGLRDQVAALHWVRENIAAFGGDPSNVTIFGESAGANAVTTLMATPSAEGLFVGAIAQSDPVDAVYYPEQTAQWAADFIDILSRQARTPIDPDRLESAGSLLARADVRQLLHASSTLQIQTPDAYPGMFCLAPVVDGDFLPEHPMVAFQSGRAHRVPMIIGSNDREGSLFRGRVDIIPRTPGRIQALFQDAPGPSRALIHAVYPGLPAPHDAADFAGDYGFWYPSTRAADFHSRFAPVWVYRFDFAPTVLRLVGLDATHGLEMFALFDELDVPIARIITSLGGRRAYAAAGGRMRANWVRFAIDGAPADSWSPYTASRRSTLIIDETDRIEDDPRSLRRLAWSEFLPRLAEGAVGLSQERAPEP
jgi:para-nitrobenzyl esterase